MLVWEGIIYMYERKGYKVTLVTAAVLMIAGLKAVV